MTKKNFIPLLMAVGLSVNACVPVVAIGAGALVGRSAVREGGLSGTASDTRIGAYINDEWLRQDGAVFRKLTVTVFEARVMITGTVQNASDRDTAIRIAWQPQGVRQVINEIRVEPSGSVGGYTRDTWISTQFKSRLLADGDVSSINYKYEVHANNIYVIGVAKNQDELNRVINHGRSISYVKDVISYIRLSGEPLPEANGSGAAATR